VPSFEAVFWDLDETIADTRFLKSARDRQDWDYCRKNIGSVKAFPGIKQAFEVVAEELHTAVITSSPRWYAIEVLQRINLEPKQLVAYRDTRKHKPHADPLLKASSLLGVDPTRCVMIGDNEKDFEAARRAGVAFFAATWGELSEEAFRELGAQVILSKPSDILEHLI
jgi:phosphoglycolate phosphatase